MQPAIDQRAAMSHASQIVLAGALHRQVAVAEPVGPDHAAIGGLMAYGAEAVEIARQQANQIAQILKGTRPGDIPFYQQTKFALVINLKTTKALGLTFPPSILARADEVIE